MRILIVHNILWAHYKAKLFQELSRLVDQESDVQLRVVQIARNERSRAGLEQDANAQNAPVYEYPCELLFDQFIEEVSVWAKIRALLRQLREFQPDVINLTGYYDPAQLAVLAYARLRGIRVVMQNESTAQDHVRIGPREWLKRQIFRQCDGFFCFGTRSARYLLDFGVPTDQILLQKNAVDNDELLKRYQQTRPQRDENQRELGLPIHNFVFVGRLISLKNLTALLDAFASARQQADAAGRWGLVLLGEGPERASLQARADALGLTDAVRLLPGRPWFGVPGVLALADVLVLPSLVEPWGLVVNEAMVCGLPVVVSSRCGCVADLVRDGQNGYVIDPTQPDQLVQALRRFMAGEADLSRMGAESKRLIEPYSAEAVAAEMLAGFKTVLR